MDGDQRFYLFEVIARFGSRTRIGALNERENHDDCKSVAITAANSMDAILKAAKWFSEHGDDVSRLTANVLCTSSRALTDEVEEIVLC